MFVQITDLPPQIQAFLHQRQREQGNDGIFDGDLSMGVNDGNIVWDQTPEEDFWSGLYEGADMSSHPLYIQLMKSYEIY